jgi:hypothetical protein
VQRVLVTQPRLSQRVQKNAISAPFSLNAQLKYYIVLLASTKNSLDRFLIYPNPSTGGCGLAVKKDTKIFKPVHDRMV